MSKLTVYRFNQAVLTVLMRKVSNQPNYPATQSQVTSRAIWLREMLDFTGTEWSDSQRAYYLDPFLYVSDEERWGVIHNFPKR